jgi:hypothetical protein
MAVGAGRADVYRLILREGAVVIAGALGAGLAGALLLTRCCAPSSSTSRQPTRPPC